MTKPIVLVLVSLLAAACTSTVVNADDEHPSHADAYRLYLAPSGCMQEARCDPTAFMKEENDDEATCEMHVNAVFGAVAGESSCSVARLKQCVSDRSSQECTGEKFMDAPASCQGCN